MKKTRLLNILDSLNIFYFWTLPSLTTVAVLGYYTVVMEKELNSSKTFVTLTTLLLLQEPLRSIPSVITKVIQMVVSIKRIQELIDSKPWVPINDSRYFLLENCSFAYGTKKVLENLSLKIEENEFLAIIGPVGSGKTSFLLSLMGEIPLVSGSLKINSNIAYAPSLDSWLLNASLRENILMGKDFKETWY